MFRIVCDLSSGSTELCLTEITRDVFVCLVGVWQRNFEPAVCVCVCVCVWARARARAWYDGPQHVVPCARTHARARTHTASSKLRCQIPTYTRKHHEEFQSSTFNTP